MNRRQFLAGLGPAPFAVGAAAQPLRPRVAILSPASPRNEMAMRSVHRPFKEALRTLDDEAGRHTDIVERFADGDESRLSALAAELVALQPQVLFTNTSYSASAAACATHSIPIVVGPAGETVLRELAGTEPARRWKVQPFGHAAAGHNASQSNRLVLTLERAERGHDAFDVLASGARDRQPCARW